VQHWPGRRGEITSLGQGGQPCCRRAPEEVGQAGNVLREVVPEILDPLGRRSLGQERVQPREDTEVPRLEPLQQAVEEFLNAIDELGECHVGRTGRIQGRPVRPPRQAARISLTRQAQPEPGCRVISRNSELLQNCPDFGLMPILAFRPFGDRWRL
jgi:hypothetical protein